MNYDEFVCEIKKQVVKLLGDDYIVSTHKVMKNNSMELIGLSIREEGREVSPTFYLEGFFQQYKEGRMISDIIRELDCLYQEAKRHMLEADYMSFDMEYANCQDKIVMRLISKKRNEKMLEDLPHLCFLDLAVIFTIVYRHTKDGLESVRVSHELCDKWNVGLNELKRVTKKNTQRIFPPKVSNMVNIVESFLSEEEKESLDLRQPMGRHIKVLTNTAGINGATVLLYDDFIKNIADELESNLYILPSSIHEVLVIPVESGAKLNELSETVMHVNQVAVSKEEYLSDTVYMYNRKTETFIYQ